MKNLVLLLTCIHFTLFGFATTYYSQGSSDPSLLSSWNTLRAGGGAAPSSFTQAGDIFIIQAGDIMVTTKAYSFGAAGSVLRIEADGSLQADHNIILTGSFEIQDDGIYIHNNKASGIFGGTENFAANSTIEFRDWVNSTTALPAGIAWGNLTFNMGPGFSGEWQLAGSLSNIQGTFTIINGGKDQIVLTGNELQNISIGGDLIIQSGTLTVKSLSDEPVSSTIQVNGDINIIDGELNLGTVDFIGNNNVLFKGNLSVSETGLINSASPFAFLEANGTATQTFSCANFINASLKIHPGATAVLQTNLEFGPSMIVVVAGTMEASIYLVNIPDGQLFIPGGTFNTSVGIDLVNSTCKVCTGDGNNQLVEWCKETGSAGKLVIDGGGLLFGESNASQLLIGAPNSPGDVSVEDGIISFNAENTGDATQGTIQLQNGSSLYLNTNSFVEGNAFYESRGGKLIIGSTDGIYSSDQAGAIQVTGARNYSASGINSFEYRSNADQYTGDGLPASINGNLVINNLAGETVNLQNATHILSGGKLVLTKGYLSTVGENVVTLEAGATVEGGSTSSFVDGRMTKIGNTNFTFPVGKAGRYSPVIMNNVSGQALSDEYSAEYFPGNPKATYNGDLLGMVRISSVEYWEVDRLAGAGTKQVSFGYGTHSGVSNPSTLVVAYFDDVYWQNYGKVSVTGTASSGTITANTSAFGVFTLGTTSEENSLPLHLLKFEVRKTGNSRQVYWELSPEDNSEYFEILTSSNNRDYTVLGKLPAISGQYKYSFSDRNNPGGATYYRLRVLGRDGKISYSKVVVIFNEASDYTSVSVAPTITRQSATLTIVSAASQKIRVSITSISGQVIKTSEMEAREGSNTYQVKLSGLSAGQYFITVTDEMNNRQTVRVTKK